MAYTPEHLSRWTSEDPAFGGANNYLGANLTAFYVAPVSIARDTEDSVSLSNWRVVGSELDKLAEHDESGEAEFGHWACGWYRLWLIHESDTAALKCADEWAAALSDYPVADEDDLSELEHDAETQAWEDWAGSEWRGRVVSALTEYAPEPVSPYWADELLETLPGESEKLYSLWHELTEQCSWFCYHENDGPRFNFDDPAEMLSASVLSELVGLTLLPPDQQWRAEPYPWPDGSTEPLVAPIPELVG